MAGISESYGTNGLMQVKNNDQLNIEARAEYEQDTGEPEEEVITNLAAHCRKEWVRCRDAKMPIE